MILAILIQCRKLVGDTETHPVTQKQNVDLSSQNEKHSAENWRVILRCKDTSKSHTPEAQTYQAQQQFDPNSLSPHSCFCNKIPSLPSYRALSHSLSLNSAVNFPLFFSFWWYAAINFLVEEKMLKGEPNFPMKFKKKNEVTFVKIFHTYSQTISLEVTFQTTSQARTCCTNTHNI